MAQDTAELLQQSRVARQAAEEQDAAAAREKAQVDDAYVRGLNQEIRNLQAILVDREAAIARAEASLEHVQVRVVARPAPAHWEPLPGGLSPPREDDKKPDSHLARDFILVFAVVCFGCLAYFFGPSLLASSNWQLPNLTNFFASGDSDDDAPAPPVAAQAPKLLPQAVVLRDVNLRAAPSINARVIASLKQGTAVAILDRQGKWDHIEIVMSGETSRQGWAYGSYLSDKDKNPGPKP